MNPCDYSLCTHTVTVYRREKAGIFRQVLEGCFFGRKGVFRDTETGAVLSRPFLLILPADRGSIRLLDWICPGVGPEVSPEDWKRLVPELFQVRQCAPRYFQGELCHWEAEG